MNASILSYLGIPVGILLFRLAQSEVRAGKANLRLAQQSLFFMFLALFIFTQLPVLLATLSSVLVLICAFALPQRFYTTIAGGFIALCLITASSFTYSLSFLAFSYWLPTASLMPSPFLLTNTLYYAVLFLAQTILIF